MKISKMILAAAIVTSGFGVALGDVTMWGMTQSRNMVSTEKNPIMDWESESGKNIKWIANLGSKSYGNPVIADGIVWVGTNNEAVYDPNIKGDKGNLIGFRAKDGKFLYQRVSDKLPTGRVNDWPGEGMCCTPTVEKNFLYYCTNRCELVCLDVSPLVASIDKDKHDAPKVVWSLDMIKELGVFPHNMTSSSPLIWGDYIYILTGNGVDETHKHLPAPSAPSLICVNKTTGKVVWTNNSPGDRVLHGQWSSPTLAEVNGVTMVIAGMGDGWIRSFDAKTGKIIWEFDANLKNTVYPTTKNEIIATPVVVGTKMYIAVGQDPEHGEGSGYFWCIDITKKGDISKELVDETFKPDIPPGLSPEDAALEIAMAAKKGKPNPNSGVVWEYGQDEGVKIVKSKNRMNRSMSTVSVINGLVFAPDLSGYMHCFDAETGKKYWIHDNESAIWGSTMALDGKVYLTTETGFVRVYEASKELKVIKELEVKTKAPHDKDHPDQEAEWESAILYCTPIFDKGTLYLMTRDKLIAIEEKK
jgi:outer membrane protein assembly factor BamB